MPEATTKRDRSPNFPCIALNAAIERLIAFEKYFGRHPTPLGKSGLAWGMKENSDQAGQILSALRSYGLVEYQGNPPNRQVIITEAGRTYLRAQQGSIKESVLRQAALRPRMIRKFWASWGADRPPDPVCMDDLTIHNGFSDRGAPLFLKIYDGTIAFAGLSQGDKIEPDSAEDAETVPEGGSEAENEAPQATAPKPPPPPPAKGAVIMDGERELTTGLLSRDASFRLIVSGPIGVREIERLIKKLELDKEILADDGEGSETDERDGL